MALNFLQSKHWLKNGSFSLSLPFKNAASFVLIFSKTLNLTL